MTADGRVVLGDQQDRAALMLADRRHRRCAGREVCQHCDESWPCDARRALDVLNRAIAAGDALADHVDDDHQVLGRVREVVISRVVAWTAVGLSTAELIAADVVAALGETDPASACLRCSRTRPTLAPVPPCCCVVRCTHTQCGRTTP